MKYVCSECGNDGGLRHDNFYHDGSLISESNYCDECMTFTDWVGAGSNNCMDYSTLRTYITEEEKKANYVGKINEYIQKNGLKGSVKDYITINRTGGADHNPKFKVTIDLQEIKAEAEGYFSKKDCTHVASIVWWEKAGNLVNKINNSTKKIKSDLSVGAKIAKLKSVKILTKYIKPEDIHKIHGAYHDYKNGVSYADIKNKYNI